MAITDWIQEHPDVAMAGGVVGALLIAGYVLSRNQAKALPTTAATRQDLSGLTNGLVYVPTQTTFSTYNQEYGPYSNDPNLTTVTGSPAGNTTTTTTINKPVTTTTTTTTTDHDPQHPKPKQPPPPPPNPPPTHGKGLIWDQGYTVSGGETLSSIAARLTTRLRAQGMPGSMTVTWHDLYAHNTGVINQYAQQHGYRSDYWNWIFPGERLSVPRWG